MNTKIMPGISLILLFFATYGLSQELNRVTLKAASVYRAWAQTDSTLMCGALIKTPQNPSPRKLPIHVVVAVDVSRDMQGEPLTYAKKSADLVLSRLRDGDYFGVISYSTYTRTVFPLQPVTDGIRRSAASAIDGIAGEKNRNLSEAINSAVSQFDRFRGQNTSGRHLFIITNGDADKGITDNPELLSHTYSLSRKMSIQVSTFGVEHAFNEQLLSETANKTGGQYYYAEEPEFLQESVDKEITRIAQSAVRSIRLKVDPPDQVVLSEVYGGEKKDNEIFIGDLAAGIEKSVFFRLSGRPSKQKDCVVEMQYLEPGSQNVRKERVYVDIPLTDGKPDYNPEIVPHYLVFSVLNDLVTYSGHVFKNRRGYTDFFRTRLHDLEQENVTLESDFVSRSVVYFTQLDRRIANTAIEPEKFVKGIKFDSERFLRGDLIK